MYIFDSVKRSHAINFILMSLWSQPRHMHAVGLLWLCSGTCYPNLPVMLCLRWNTLTVKQVRPIRTDELVVGVVIWKVVMLVYESTIAPNKMVCISHDVFPHRHGITGEFHHGNYFVNQYCFIFLAKTLEWSFLSFGSASGRHWYVVSHWLSPHQEWSLHYAACNWDVPQRDMLVTNANWLFLFRSHSDRIRNFARMGFSHAVVLYDKGWMCTIYIKGVPGWKYIK